MSKGGAPLVPAAAGTRRCRSCAAGLLLSALTILSSAPLTFAVRPAAEKLGKPFWTALAKDCAVPAGESAFSLVTEAVGFLASPDTQWRDDVGYGVVEACVYRKRALKPEERRTLIAQLSGNLRRGLWETGTDSVLLRSFSALDLSILAALENADPALDGAGYQQLVDNALAYLQDERDLRGLEPRVGWIHATAHTADLLKFLARDRRFARVDQTRLLDAAWAKMTTAGTPVFRHAEDERLAAAIVSVVRRQDFEPTALDPWLARFVTLEKQVWAKAPPDTPTLDASLNARQLLRALFTALSLPAPGRAGMTPAPASAAETSARHKVLATHAAFRRS